MPDAKKKYLDKFETDEELAKAYAELEKKFGDHSNELGQTRKQVEESQRAMQAYAEQMQGLNTYKQWYDTNAQSLQLYNNWLQNGGREQPPVAVQPNNGQRSLVDLLTPEEKKALFTEFVQTFDSGVFKPWQQNFAQQLERIANDRQNAVLENVTKNQRAFTEVLWRTMQHALPEDKVAAMRDWHTKALEMGDPSKFDPMKMADEYLGTQTRLSSLEAEKKALEAEREKWQKDSMPTVAGGRNGGSWLKPDETAPKDKQERFERAMSDTTERVGRDAVKEAFGGR